MSRGRGVRPSTSLRLLRRYTIHERPRGATTLLVAAAALFSASACGPPTPQPVVTTSVDVPLPKVEPVTAGDPVFQVAAVQAPARTSVDGDLGEWGAAGPADAAAVSHVAVALAAEGVFVAARLAGSARDGFWIGVAASPSELPPVGILTRTGGGEVDPLMEVVEPGCTAPRYGDHADDDREEGPECLAVRKADDEVAERHARRFERWYRVEPGGIQVVGEGGKLAPVKSAQVVFKPAGAGAAAGAVAEVSIPPEGMPRLAQAPVAELWLAARAVSAGVPDLPALLDAKNNRPLPQPVAFEPMAALRAQALERSLWMSYHPADLLHVEVMRYPSLEDRASFATTVEHLYRKQAAIGEAEVGYLTIAAPPDNPRESESDRVALAILARGKTTVLPMEGAPMAVIPRGGGLHVVSFVSFERMVHDGSPNSVFLRSRRAWLSIVTVAPDGQYAGPSLDGEKPSGWSEVEAFQDGESLGLRGMPEVWLTVPPALAGKRVELRWRWDAKKNAYQAEKPKRVGK